MHLCAFIAIFVPKLVAMVTPLCPLCTGVSQMNSPMHKPYLKTKLYMDLWLKTEVMAISVIFRPIVAKIWLPWQRPLDPCNQKCLLWIGWPQKPPVVSNQTVVVSRRNAFMCIYNNFCPKIGCHGNALCPLYTGVSQLNCQCTNPISKPNSAWMCGLKVKLRPFLWFCGLFWPKFGCHGNVP